MTQAKYNTKVQELQEMWGDACRARPHYHEGRLMRATFDVYWDGRWQTLGWQHNPMTPQVRYEWEDVLELELRGAFAAALIHS